MIFLNGFLSWGHDSFKWVFTSAWSGNANFSTYLLESWEIFCSLRSQVTSLNTNSRFLYAIYHNAIIGSFNFHPQDTQAICSIISHSLDDMEPHTLFSPIMARWAIPWNFMKIHDWYSRSQFCPCKNVLFEHLRTIYKFDKNKNMGVSPYCMSHYWRKYSIPFWAYSPFLLCPPPEKNKQQKHKWTLLWKWIRFHFQASLAACPHSPRHPYGKSSENNEISKS